MRILVIGAYPRSLVDFRGRLLATLVEMGHDVYACADTRDDTGVAEELRVIGVRYCPVPINRTGLGLIADIHTFFRFYVLVTKIKPHIVLSYTIKPVIYGGGAAALGGGSHIYSMITGLGYTMSEASDVRHRVLKALVKFLYKKSLASSVRVFFQNNDDLFFFKSSGLVKEKQGIVINGSGVDLDYYAPAPQPQTPSFLLLGRLLADKGIREYMAAADELRSRFPLAGFFLAGSFDPNPSAIREEELLLRQREGVIDFLGNLSDVRPALADCSVYVLPSYREGLPRSVLEAMAMGRAVITSDAPGCRETVSLTKRGVRQRSNNELVMEGENGFLVRPRNVEALVAAMQIFLEQPGLAARMGIKGREIAEEKFDVNKVNAVILREMGVS